MVFYLEYSGEMRFLQVTVNIRSLYEGFLWDSTLLYNKKAIVLRFLIEKLNAFSIQE